MLESKSQVLLSLPDKDLLYLHEMTLGKRIKEARVAVRPKLTQAAVGKALGVTDKAVSAWERDQDAPTPDKFPKLAAILKRSIAYLHGQDTMSETVNQGATPREIPIARQRKVDNVRNPADDKSLAQIPGSQLVGERDLPVFGTSQGGKGAVIVTSDPVDWVARPEPLARVKDGYGIIITEDSMAPEFRSGDIALVNPHLPARAGDTCVFRSDMPDHTILSCIKFLRRQTADSWHVTEWNSDEGKKRDFTLKKAEWQTCHVTVGKYSRG